MKLIVHDFQCTVIVTSVCICCTSSWKKTKKKRMLQGLDAPRIRADAILTGSSVNISLWIQNKIVSQFW